MDRLIKISILLTIIVIDACRLNGIDIPTPPCMVKSIFEIECWGCGMSRAILKLFELDFVQAINLHTASPLVLMLLVWIFWKSMKGISNG